MLNEFYKYIANSMVSFFQSRKAVIRPGERYCLRLDTEEMVAGVDQALRSKTLTDGIQGSYQYGDVYDTFTIRLSASMEIVVASRINGMTDDFLATLRNAELTENHYPILMITHSPIDTITSGTGDLAANGMPFHAASIISKIKEDIRSAELPVADRTLLELELARKQGDRFSDKSSLFEYSNLLTVLGRGYVYSPLSEIQNENVWEYLLQGEGKSAWDTDNNYLYNLYRGESLSEEDSVVGQVDKENMKITGNSRFGCWICTMVKEDKSLKNFIDHGATDLIPLRDFRNWLVELRANPEARDYRRRNGSVYLTASGDFGRGPFTMEARKEILRRLLRLEVETGFELITSDELKMIDKLWEDEGDLSRRSLVEIYAEEKGERLPWDAYKKAKYDGDTIAHIRDLCDKYDVPFDLMSKLMISVDNSKFYTRSAVVAKNVEKILNEGWLHFEAIREGLNHED